MKKKTLLAPSLFLSGILLFSGCGSSATTSAVHQNKSADSWAVEASEHLDDSGFSYDGEADMMDDTATAETAGSSSDSSVSDAATDAAEATHDQSTRKLIRTVSMDIATEDLDTLRTKLDNSITSCGGYIESSTLDTPQNGYSRRSYYVTARIPSDNLDSFPGNCRNSGHRHQQKYRNRRHYPPIRRSESLPGFPPNRIRPRQRTS